MHIDQPFYTLPLPQFFSPVADNYHILTSMRPPILQNLQMSEIMNICLSELGFIWLDIRTSGSVHIVGNLKLLLFHDYVTFRSAYTCQFHYPFITGWTSQWFPFIDNDKCCRKQGSEHISSTDEFRFPWISLKVGLLGHMTTDNCEIIHIIWTILDYGVSLKKAKWCHRRERHNWEQDRAQQLLAFALRNCQTEVEG